MALRAPVSAAKEKDKEADLKKGFIDAHVHVWTPDTDKYPPLTAEDTLSLAYQLFRGNQKEEFEAGYPVDTSHQITVRQRMLFWYLCCSHH